MKKRTIAITLVLTLVLCMLLTFAAFGDTKNPGTSEDPIVAKSYVDARVSYAPVQLTMGQSLIGGEGTEIILRSGIATAIDNGANGVSDITAGKDLMTGNDVGLNHLILIPRDDGRGITAVTDIWVMVRGDYTIRN